mgnify:CR=1 FL=1
MSSDAVKNRKEIEAQVLDHAPRLTREDSFKFACHPGVSCFGDCCGDINIVLTPYDVLRLKNRLGITSGEFLDQYTVLPFTEEQRIPAPIPRVNTSTRTAPTSRMSHSHSASSRSHITADRANGKSRRSS